jgi:hypothetical protein
MTETAELTIAERVDAGWTLLGEERPGWQQEVRLDVLDLQWTDECVLGQVYGSYDAGFDLLGLSAEDAVDLGFAARVGISVTHAEREWCEGQYAELTAEWRRRLTEAAA